jgi:hypothetical protein
VTNRWARVESLCHAALARPAPERAAFLAEACGADESLRLDVASLVAQAESAASFLETPVAGAAEDAGLAVIGSTISHYRIVGQAGVGGMGVVYLAEDTRLNRKVALKFLPPAAALDPHTRARFLREAQAASALDHPNLATVYEVGEWNGQLFIAMPYYEGETLKQRIERAALSIAEAAAIAGHHRVGPRGGASRGLRASRSEACQCDARP